jgi:hypothetical protein
LWKVTIGKVRKDILNEARDRFCQFHKSEWLIEKGIRAGYLLHISFDRIPDRVKDHRPRLDSIIAGTIPSTFKTAMIKSFEELGSLRGQSMYC